MVTITDYLTRLDYWRNFPVFQLERHIDIYFSFYLKSILSKHFKTEISEYIIPEFPVNQKLTRRNPRKGVYSDNIDYIVPSADFTKIYFVELKTDMKSIRRSQNDLMEKCNDMKFQDVLCGLLDIAVATKDYSKYAMLVKALEEMDFLCVPSGFWDLDYGKSPKGYKQTAKSIEVNNAISTSIVSVFIQPAADNHHAIETIGFTEIANGLIDIDKTFSMMLKKWIHPPGYRRDSLFTHNNPGNTINP